MTTGVTGVISLMRDKVSSPLRHVLVQQNQVVGRFAALVQCILPVGYGFYLVSFLFEKKNMRFQQFYFIVYPK